MEGEHQLRTELREARLQTDDLFRIVRPDSLYERPVPERHRLNFYLGHLEAFDWNMICRYGLSVPSFHEEFDKLFAFGIDPGAEGLPQDKPSDWPAIGEIAEYNSRVRRTVDKLLDEAPEEILHVAIEHRLMHAETLAYLLHNLAAERKIAPRLPQPQAAGPATSPEMVEIPAGCVTLGRRRDSGFGWDNEFEAHCVDVPAFTIGKHKVTNGQFLEFVRAGADPPNFWRSHDGGWLLRAMFCEVPLPVNWPVWVTNAQAAAYADWVGKSLPTEGQLQRAAYGTPDGVERPYPWGSAPPDASRGNFDFHRWDPIPVTATPAGDSAFGISQLLGNGWEWTSTLFRPFPGFRQFPFYPGYSANFFDDEHYVMKGAAPRTARRLLRASFRNWFRPSYLYVHAGFRCVEN